jgi:PAS domain S-box-containing protein
MISRLAVSTAKKATTATRSFASAWSGDLSFSSPESDFLVHAVPRSDHIGAHHEWTRSLSYASAESDFKSAYEVHNTPAPPAEWSEQLSFTSPYADFTSHPTAPVPNMEWSSHYTFASPEADFHHMSLSQHQTHEQNQEMIRNRAQPELTTETTPLWSNDLSFATPESDFLEHAVPRSDHVGEHHEWTQSMSFASPESDFNSAYEVHNTPWPTAEWSGHLSFSSPEADFTCHPSAPDMEFSNQYSFASPEADFQVMELPQVSVVTQTSSSEELYSLHPFYQRSISHPESAFGEIPIHQLMASLPVEPLPLTFEEAMRDHRAVVITSADKPFEIVDVNDAWVGLCGFPREEALHGSLNMLQGQATNQRLLDALMAGLVQGREGQTVVTNYKKSGETFVNHVRAGVIRDAQTHKVTHFVGVLQEIPEQYLMAA